MVTLTNHESELKDQLLDALEETIEDIPTVDMEYATKTKIQKLLYYAINEFDIPITYSWYLAGAVVPDRSIGPESLQTARSEPSGPSAPGPTSGNIEEIDSAEQNPIIDDESEDETVTDEEEDDSPTIDPIMFTEYSDHTEENKYTTPDSISSLNTPGLTDYVTHDELTSFFQVLIPRVWREQQMRFLQNFYQEMAPDEYRLLYIESTHLRTHLAELIELIEAQLNGESPKKSIESLRESIELSISDFHYQLRKNDTTAETFDIVVEGTDLLEDAILGLDQLEKDKFTQNHLELLQELKSFFFYYVWRYPCLLISEETATGPKADELRQQRRNQYETFEKQVQKKQSELSEKLDDAALLPGANEYPTIEDAQIRETLTDLSSEYLE